MTDKQIAQLVIESDTTSATATVEARISSNQVKRLTADAVDEMVMPEDVVLAIKANVAVIQTISEQIDFVEKRLQERVKPRAEYGLLTSAPGIGRVLATTILLETGPIDRFGSAGQFASYARCVDSRHSSNGKKKGTGNTKNGNKYCPGPSWKPHISHCVIAPRRSDSTNGRRRRRTTWSRSRRWRTSWPERASTCSRSASHLTWRAASHE